MLKKTLILIFSCITSTYLAQKKDSVPDHAQMEVIRTAKEKREPQQNQALTSVSAEISKSARTATPTTIKLKRSDLINALRIQDLITAIPTTCSVSASSVTIRHSGKQNALMSNTGNSLNYEMQPYLWSCDWIMFENICSSCPQEHKANYKIIVE